MKKYLCFLFIMFTLVTQSTTMLADGLQAPILLHLRKTPWNNGIPRPSKSEPEPTVSAYLNESSDSLLLYSSVEESLTYYIYDEDELLVNNGNVSFSDQGEASIYLGTLEEGTYIIFIVVNDAVYEGEFEL